MVYRLRVSKIRDRIIEAATSGYLCLIGFRRLRGLHNQYVEVFCTKKGGLREVHSQFLENYRLTKDEPNKQRCALNLWIAATSDPVSSAEDVKDFFLCILSPRDQMWKRHFTNLMIDLYEKLLNSSPKESLESILFADILSVIRNPRNDV